MSLRPAIKLYQQRGSKIVTAPAVEPVTADQLRAYLVETEAGMPDSEATDLIKEARQMIEDHTGLALITQTWALALDVWPMVADQWWDGVRQGAISELQGAGDIELPRYPVQSLTSVLTYNDNNDETDATAVFIADTYRVPGRITVKKGMTVPFADRSSNAIIITYVAGYGDAATSIPTPLVRAVKQVAAYLYSHKGDDCAADEALAAAGSALASYRVVRI